MNVPIDVTDAERDSGVLSAPKISQAIDAIDQSGYTTLLNVAQVAHVDALYRQMVQDIEQWNATAAEPVVRGNFTPSRRPQLLFPDILMNRIIAQILRQFLGPEVSCGMYSSNVTFPGRGEQELHVDRKPDVEGADLTLPGRSVVVNFPLVDFTLENGATELWPGTHRVMREPGQTQVSQRLQDLHRIAHAPVRATMPRGAALIRDTRLWHRGTINGCDYIRPMIALICDGGYRPDVDDVGKISSLGAFPLEARPLFEHRPPIYYNVEFMEGVPSANPGHLPQTISC